MLQRPREAHFSPLICKHQELRDRTGARLFSTQAGPGKHKLIYFSFEEGRAQTVQGRDSCLFLLPRKAQLKAPTHSTPSFQGLLIRSLGPNHKHGKLRNHRGQQSEGCIKGEFQQNAARFLNSYQMSSRRLKLLQ